MTEKKKPETVLELDDPLESKTMPKATLPPEVAPEEFYRERMPTVTDESALEEARLRSVVTSSLPPKRQSHDDLSLIKARLAPLDRVPSLTRRISELSEDPKTAYILSFIDGVLPLETILDVVGLPEIEVLALVDRLVNERSIIFATKP